MNVLSLFDGMSCGQLALDRAGIPYDKYYASEIDLRASAVAKRNYPDMIHVGDVRGVTPDVVQSKIDLLLAGSPCQGFSFAGKQLNFDDPRSKLFFEFIRILNEFKPKHFLLENVPMKQEFQDVISGYLGVKPIMIDSAHFSAQQRKRLYWTNLQFPAFPEACTLTTEDILENSVHEKYHVSKDNARTIMDNEVKKGKIRFLSDDDYVVHGIVLGLDPDIRYCRDTVMPCLTPGRLTKRQNGRRFKPQGSKFYTLTAQDIHGVFVNGRIRKVTPLECERLQTVPEHYTACAPETQRYKMLGNGWTVEVIAHLLKGLK